MLVAATDASPLAVGESCLESSSEFCLTFSSLRYDAVGSLLRGQTRWRIGSPLLLQFPSVPSFALHTRQMADTRRRTIRRENMTLQN